MHQNELQHNEKRQKQTDSHSGLPLIVGQALTFALAFYALGRLNSASASFTALLMGLGFDGKDDWVDCGNDKSLSTDLLGEEFEELFIAMDRYDYLLLCHKSIPAYKTAEEIQRRMST